jgi:hypothetical protein
MQPKIGDVILRANAAGGFDIVEAVTEHPVMDPVPDARAALALAFHCGAKTVWQQNVDNRGRKMGDPYPLQFDPDSRHNTPTDSR